MIDVIATLRVAGWLVLPALALCALALAVAR